MFMNKKKNNTTTRLPMTGKVKKGFRFYCSLVAVLTIIAGTCVPAFAATSDPITVVNNLSDFISDLSVQSDLSCSASVLCRWVSR